MLIEHSDQATGDYDVEFNYAQIRWETGDASGGNGALGGSPARAGFASTGGATFEINGSGGVHQIVGFGCRHRTDPPQLQQHGAGALYFSIPQWRSLGNAVGYYELTNLYSFVGLPVPCHSSLGTGHPPAIDHHLRRTANAVPRHFVLCSTIF